MVNNAEMRSKEGDINFIFFFFLGKRLSKHLYYIYSEILQLIRMLSMEKPRTGTVSTKIQRSKAPSQGQHQLID